MVIQLPVAQHRKRPTSTGGRVLNVAHRGASARAPENTLAAVRAAAEAGADVVEVDVQRSRDGALVLMHDTTLVRTTDARARFPRRGPWRVGDFTLAELQQLDAGSWRSPLFAGEQIPVLADVVDTVRNTSSGLLVELKAPHLHPGIVSDVAAVSVAGRMVVQSFDVAAMKDHKTQAPAVPVGLLGRPAPGNLAALSSWADQVNPCHLTVDKKYVERVQELGMRCLVWTVDGSRATRRVLRLGVDGVITNRPGALAHVLAGRSSS